MTLFDQFDSLDLAHLQAMLGVQEENLHLEFKSADESRFDKRDNRKNLAAVLSGFANADGGICLWGIDARKDQDGVDVAQSIVPFPQVATALARLNELTASAVNPVVDGVRHKAMITTGQDGVVATLVPPSDSGPHMARLGEDRYFKRSGASFVKMEHFDIEDMFGRRAKPKLSLEYRVGPQGSHPSGAGHFLAVLSIVNSGRATAVGPFLSLRVPKPYRLYEYGLDGNYHHGLPPIKLFRVTEWKAFGGSEGILVYPGVALDVTPVEIELSNEQRVYGVKDLQIEYRLAAANFRLVEGTLTIAASDLPP
jgi:hypothetical protein